MKVLKSYGTSGGVIVSTAYAPDDIEVDEPVFICFDGLPVPFFIEEWSAKGTSKAFVKLEDIDTLESAEELVGRELFFDEEEYEDGQAIEGFSVYAVAEADSVVAKDGLAAVHDVRLDSEVAEKSSVAETGRKSPKKEPTGKLVGKVSSFLDIPSNPCIEVIEPDGTLVVVPCHEDLVVSVDTDKRQIVLRVPEGLV